MLQIQAKAATVNSLLSADLKTNPFSASPTYLKLSPALKMSGIIALLQSLIISLIINSKPINKTKKLPNKKHCPEITNKNREVRERKLINFAYFEDW